jgi:hypothetical protein
MARAYWHSKNWGGKRQGAGRPLPGSPTRSISITLPQDLIEAVDQQAYQHHATRSAVIARYLTQALNKIIHTQSNRKNKRCNPVDSKHGGNPDG